MQGASEPVCTGKVLKGLQGASPRGFCMKDGEDRRKSTVLTGNMVVLAIKAQDRGPGPGTTMLSQGGAEQEPALPEAALSWCDLWMFLSGVPHSSPLHTTAGCREMGWEETKGVLGQKQHTGEQKGKEAQDWVGEEG